MRIAMISEHASPLACLGGVDSGGQNVYVAQVARELARLGHHVDVLTRRDAIEQPPVVHMEDGVRVLHIPAGPPSFVPKEQLLPHMTAFSRVARRILGRGTPYDMVHANFFMSGQVGLNLKACLGVPMVTTFHALGLVRREHQGSADLFPPCRIDIERQIVRRSDRLIAECPQDRSDLIRLYGAQARQISMVPCGVDLSEFPPTSRVHARKTLGLRADEFVVLQLGRLVPRKGVDNVIRALAHLGANARLMVVGGESAEPDETRTPEIGRLKRVAAECGVLDRVVFTGHRQRKELATYYAAADVFVSTPWYEPFGITPLEAMASGVPVVGSAVGGIQYSVVDGETGLLVPPHDPVALADRLGLLRANPALVVAMGRAGRRRVSALFTWARVAAQIADVYRSVARPAPATLRRPAAAVGQLSVGQVPIGHVSLGQGAGA